MVVLVVGCVVVLSPTQVEGRAVECASWSGAMVVHRVSDLEASLGVELPDRHGMPATAAQTVAVRNRAWRDSLVCGVWVWVVWWGGGVGVRWVVRGYDPMVG